MSEVTVSFTPVDNVLHGAMLKCGLRGGCWFVLSGVLLFLPKRHLVGTRHSAPMRLIAVLAIFCAKEVLEASMSAKGATAYQPWSTAKV